MAKDFVITWIPPNSGDAPDNYRVEYAVSGQSTTTVHTGSGDPAYRLTGLTAYEVYQVRVGAINAAGSGDYSSLFYKYASQYPSAPLALASGAPSSSGDLNLTWSTPQFNGDTAITDYEVVYTPSGASPSGQLVGSTTTALNLTSLDCSKEHYVVVAAVNTAGSGLVASGTFSPYCGAAGTTTTTTTAAPGGITPVADNQVRFYVPASATAIKVNATTSTGYFALTDGTNTSTVYGSNYYTAGNYSYMYMAPPAVLSTLVAGDRVVRLYPCNVGGTYDSSATIQAISLISNDNAITAIDISHCSGLYYFGAMSDQITGAGRRKQFGSPVTSLQPTGITEIRAVGLKLGTGPQTYITHHSMTAYNGWYWSEGGADIREQDLDAAALDQFYTDLISDADPTLGSLLVTGNPGTGSDTPSIATGKGYTVEG